MSEWWQHIPEQISPIVFSIGGFSIRWYGVCFAIGILLMWRLWLSLCRKERWGIPQDSLEALFLWVVVGAGLGARLGYVLWYAPAYFFAHPWSMVLPFSPVTWEWEGISGLSFHGAIAGSFLALWWHARRKQLGLWVWADRFFVAVPLGIFFGRLGNFLNGELWGRPTEQVWGMFFLSAPGGALRHPSALYEMLGEGVILFGILWWLRRWYPKCQPGFLSGCFLMLYGMMRFVLEYWREPDVQLGLFWGIFSLGQLLSLVLLFLGGIVCWQRRGVDRSGVL